MTLDLRIAEPTLENLIRDSILYALGQRLAAVADVATLRTVPTQSEGMPQMDDDKIVSVLSSPVTSYRWSTVSLAPDDGETVIQPSDVPAGGNGRWVIWMSDVYFAPTVGGDVIRLDQISASGPLQRVIIVDKHFDVDEVIALLGGAVPAVLVEPKGDDPEEITQTTGILYGNPYRFDIHVVVNNLRDRREALQGSVVPSDPDPGGHLLDGLIRALLSGVNLAPALDALNDVRAGRSEIWTSDFGERRVIKTRTYTVIVSEELPAAPNESGPVDDITAQAHLVSAAVPPPTTSTLAPAELAVDPTTYLASGILVGYPMPGLTQAVTAGAALIAGTTVVYAGANVTFSAWSDTYRDLMPNGTLTLVAVGNDGAEPPVTETALRIGVTRTNGTGVVADVVLAQTSVLYGPQFDFGPA